MSCACQAAHCHCGGHLTIVCENGCKDAEVALAKPTAIALIAKPRGQEHRAKYPVPDTCRKCPKPVKKRPPGERGRPYTHCEDHTKDAIRRRRAEARA